MFTLYHGSGSGEVQLQGEIDPRIWGVLRTKAINYLTLSGQQEAASLLQTLPFELWDGTNGFGDPFEVLYLRINIAQYLRLKIDSESHENKSRFRAMAEAVSEMGGNYVRFVIADTVDDDVVDVVSTPTLSTTSAVVERALSDFEALVQAGGAVSGVDRVHTALHGYLIEICRQENIQHNDDAPITALFSLIREHHPKFKPPGTEPQKVFRGLAQVVDAMNPVRNHSSMAHPNEVLLDEPEAMLVVNAARTLLHYLNMKLR